jgi:HSP20 family protein
MLMNMSNPLALRGLRNDLRHELDRLFTDFWQQAPNARAFPAVNLWDAGDALVAEAEVPGLQMNDLEIFVAGNELTLKGRRAAQQVPNVKYHRRERTFVEFERTLTLPVNVDAEKVEASLKNGVLSVTLPKAADAQPRRIEVKGL